jgi:hypothetical protein
MAGGNPYNQVRVPPEFNPAKAPPMRSEFALNSDDTSPEERALERRLEREKEADLNFARGGISEDVGRIATGEGATREGMSGSERSKEERRRREQFSDAALRAAQRIAEIDRMLAGLYEERDGILQDIRDTQRRIGVLDGALARLQSGEELDQNEDGSLSDREIEAQIRAYEQRTGRQVNRNDPDSLITAIQAQRAHETGEMDRHRGRERENRSDIDRWEARREAEVDTIEREHPDADVEELVAVFAQRSDDISLRARLGERDEVQVAASENFTEGFAPHEDEEFAFGDDEGFSFGAVDDELEDYEAFADEVDPDGAAQSPPADAPDQPADSQSGGIQRDGVDFGNNSSSPSGMGG